MTRNAASHADDVFKMKKFRSSLASSAPAEEYGTPAAATSAFSKKNNRSAAASSSLLFDAASSASPSVAPAAPRTTKKYHLHRPVSLVKKRKLASVVPSQQNAMSSSSSLSSDLVMARGKEHGCAPAAAATAAGKQWKKVILDATTMRICQMEGMTELEELDGSAACIFSSTDKSSLTSSGVCRITAARRSASSSATAAKTCAAAVAATAPAATAAGLSSRPAACHAFSGSATDAEAFSFEGASADGNPRAAAVRETMKKELKRRLQQQLQSHASREEQQDFEQQQQQQQESGGTSGEKGAAAGETAMADIRVVAAAGRHHVDSSRVITENDRSNALSDSRSKSTGSNSSNCERGSSSGSTSVEGSSRKKKKKQGSSQESEKKEHRRFGRSCTLDESTEHWVDAVELRQQLHGWMSLVEAHGEEDSLHPAVLRALLEGGFLYPTPVQQAVLLHALRDRRDVIAAAETGSGKTLAYGVPIVCCLLSQMLRRKEKALEKKLQQQQEDIPLSRRRDAAAEGEVDGPECLVLVPSRELAAQVQQHLAALCVYTPIRCVCLVGGLSVQKQQRLLAQQKPQILVATPGRLCALLKEAQESRRLLSIPSLSSTQWERAAAASAAGSAALPSDGDNNHGDASSISAAAAASAAGAAAVGSEAAVEVGGFRRRLQVEAHAYLSHLNTVRFLVLDEADRLVKQGSFAELDELLEAIYAATSPAARMMQRNVKVRKRFFADAAAGGGTAAISDNANEENAAVMGSRRKLAAGGAAAADESGARRSSSSSRNSRNSSSNNSSSSSRLQTFVLSATLGLSEEELRLRVKGRAARGGKEKKGRAAAAAAAGGGGAATAEGKEEKKKGHSSSSDEFAAGGRRGKKEELPAAKGIQQLMERVRLNTSRLCIVDLCSSNTEPKRTVAAAAAGGVGAAQLMNSVVKDGRGGGGGAGGQEEAVPGRQWSSSHNSNTVLHGGLVKLPDGLRISCLKTENEEEELNLAMLLLKLFSSSPVNEPCKILIFVNAISYVYRLDPLLSIILGSSFDSKPKHPSTTVAEVFGLHAQLQQKQRIKRMERFQVAKKAVLVCTDVASRGLDIHDVRHVIHFQPPRTPSLFVHRSGRTARAKQTGESICICSPAQVDAWVRVAKPLQIDLAALPAPHCLQQEQQTRVFYSQLSKMKRIFSLATQIESARHQSIKERRTSSWMKKAAAAADILIESDISGDESNAVHAKKIRGQEKELALLLSSLNFVKPQGRR